MNTKQLIVFWNGGFILFVALFALGNSISSYDQYWITNFIAVIAIIAGITLFYLTFRDSDKIDRKKVFTRGILPIPLIALLGIGVILLVQLTYTNYDSLFKTNLKNQTEIFDPTYEFDRDHEYGNSSTFTGRIRNNSSEIIEKLSVRIRIYKYNFTPPDADKVAGSDGVFSKEEMEEMLPFEGKTWTYIKSIDKESQKLVGKQIDTEDLHEDNLNIPPNETKSFKITNGNSVIKPSVFWVWDYEIIYAY